MPLATDHNVSNKRNNMNIMAVMFLVACIAVIFIFDENNMLRL